jgi:hypothetical protein
MGALVHILATHAETVTLPTLAAVMLLALRLAP